MFGWLLKSDPITAPETFFELPVGQEFKKDHDETVYVKVNKQDYETVEMDRCIHWFRAHEDFAVTLC